MVKKLKKRHIAGKPKKPMTAFLLYAGERRSVIKVNNPSLSITEITKEIGREWNLLSEESKKPYIQLAQESRIKYLEALQVFNESNEGIS